MSALDYRLPPYRPALAERQLSTGNQLTVDKHLHLGKQPDLSSPLDTGKQMDTDKQPHSNSELDEPAESGKGSGGGQKAEKRTEFAGWLQEAMRRRGIDKQASVAHACGIAQATVSMYLSSERVPRKRASVEKIAAALTPVGADPRTTRLLLNAGLMAAGLAPITAGFSPITVGVGPLVGPLVGAAAGGDDWRQMDGAEPVKNIGEFVAFYEAAIAEEQEEIRWLVRQVMDKIDKTRDAIALVNTQVDDLTGARSPFYMEPRHPKAASVNSRGGIRPSPPKSDVYRRRAHDTDHCPC